MMDVLMGIDTSNYRTSICVIDTNAQIIFEVKELLQVPSGERGLMQSEALFQHLIQIPSLFEKLSANKYNWLAVGASIRPRPIQHSYMPVFRVGESFARFVAKILNIPFYETSHQEGHIAAGLYSLGKPITSDRFLAVHLSGGTTELLVVNKTGTSYSVDILGTSKDLHAGQFIDRVGVAMGFSFPAGPEVEQLAKMASGSFSIPSSVKGYDISFSGPESAAQRALENGVGQADVALAVLKNISITVEKIIRKAISETGIKDVLIVGGVASNKYIKERLIRRLENLSQQTKLYFTSPEFSGDNAFGVACLTLEQYIHEHSALQLNE